MVFSQQFLDELKMRASLSDYVGKRVKLIKKGQEFLGLCPFHNEKTPSFTVNDDKGFYHCFGCHAHGSVIDFIMEIEGLSFRETIEKIAAFAGIELPQNTPQEAKYNQTRLALTQLMEKAAVYFQKILLSSEGYEAQKYLKTRGISKAVADSFRIGYAPKNRDSLKRTFLNSGANEELLILGGLLIGPNENENKTSYDRFRNRIIFPINNRRGQIIGFGGRVLGDGQPKYLNSPETPIYHKGNELFGFSHAIRKAREQGSIIVSEGYFDVIALHDAGFQNTVAPLGTAITENQIQLLWDTVPEPIICFDGDTAGERAAIKTATRALPFLKPGVTLRFASLPNGEDPDSLVKSNGQDQMSEVLAKSLPLSEFLWKLETQNGEVPNLPEERASLQHKLKKYALLIQDNTMQKHFLKFFNNRIWDSKQNTTQVTRKLSSKDKTSWAPNIHLEKEAGPEAKINVDFFRNSILIAGLINHPHIYDYVGERLGSINCASRSLDKLRQEVLKICEAQVKIESKDIIDQLDKIGYSDVLTNLLSEKVLEHAYFIRSGTPVKEVKSGWDEVFYQVKSKDLTTEIEVAEKKYANEPNSNTWNRLVALRKQKIDDTSGELTY